MAFRSDGVPRGEVLVWFTSTGLAVGLMLIVALVGLIVVRGLGSFWPREIVELTVRDGSSGAIGGSAKLAGQVFRRQERAIRTLDETGAAVPAEEVQLYVANRDVYGFSFRFVDAADVLAEESPEDLALLERTEGGSALGRLVALRGPEGVVVPAGDPAFEGRLEALLSEAAQRRAEIRAIERRAIGAISHRMTRLREEDRALERSGVGADRRAAIASELAQLQKSFEEKAAVARELRARQRDWTLAYVLSTGQERTVAVGDVLRVTHPNRLGFVGRLAHAGAGFWRFLSEEPREKNTEGGIFPALFGTFVMTLLMSLAVTPFGVIAAIYLREYSRQGPLVRTVRICVNNLAGVPSIVFGVFGLGFFVYFVGGTVDQLLFSQRLPTPTFGTGGVLWASLTLALLTLPVVIVATEEALAAVPRSIREAALACGASKWQTIQSIVLPAAAPGILTGFILAMARGAGEVAPLMLVGVVKLAPELPIDRTPPFIHPERKFMHLGFHIFDLGFQSPDSEAARPMVFASALVLILLVLILNLGAILIRNHLRRRYRTGAF